MSQAEGGNPLCVLVVDTNTHLGRFWRNFFFELVRGNTVLVLLSKQIYKEMEDVYLVRGRDSQGKPRKKKFNLSKQRIDAILSAMLEVHSHGRPLWDVPTDVGVHESVRGAISDKGDYHVIELARRRGADYIITFDRKFPEEYEIVENEKTVKTIKSLKPLSWVEEMLHIHDNDQENTGEILRGMAFACALTSPDSLDDSLAEIGIDPKSSEIWKQHMPRLRRLYSRAKNKLD